jgi:hypothetical protein
MDALEFFKSLPVNIKNKISQYMVAGAMSMNAVEKKSFSQNGDSAYTGERMQQGHIKNSLLASLKEGRVNKETEMYKRYFYDVLEKAEAYAQKMSPGQMQMLVENAMQEDSIDGLSESEKSDLLKRIKTFDPAAISIGEINRNKAESRTSKDDNFPLEFIVNNNKVEINSLDVTLHGARSIYEYAFNFGRNNENGILLEEYSDSLHVKAGPEGIKILEFYIPTYKIRFDVNDPIFNDMIDIRSIFFVNHIGVPYQYDIMDFYKLTRMGQSTIVKFRARGGRLSRM